MLSHHPTDAMVRDASIRRMAVVGMQVHGLLGPAACGQAAFHLLFTDQATRQTHAGAACAVRRTVQMARVLQGK